MGGFWLMNLPRVKHPTGTALILLLALVAGGALFPGQGHALDHGRPFNIGVLTISWGTSPVVAALREALLELGYRENKDFNIGVRFTQGRSEELYRGVRELIRDGADILFAGGDVSALAAKQAGTRIPVVFAVESDPVKLGLVNSFARPGGNMTGITDRTIALSGKRLQMFRNIVPGMRKVLFPYDARSVTDQAQAIAYRAAARRLGIELLERAVHTEDEARAALQGLRNQKVDGVVSPFNVGLNIPGVVLEQTTKQGIPAIFGFSFFFVEQGGLASYGPSLSTGGRLVARVMEKIFKGASPADIPVEVNTEIEFAINLKTARAMGINIAPQVLYQADRIIR